MKRTYKILMAMLLGAALLSCKKEEETPWKDLSDSNRQLYFVNTFGYNMMATYYLWNKEISEDMRGWGSYSDPIATVNALRYKQEDGTEVDKWTVMTDDYASFSSMVKGTSKSVGMEFSAFYADNTQQNVVLAVNFVYEGSPAAEAGYKRGDKIVAINGTLLTPSNYKSLVNNGIYGADSVELTNADDSKVTLSAREMYLEPINCHKIIEKDGKKIAYLHYTSFTLRSMQPLVDLFKQFKAAGVSELVLDLRYNGGGYSVASQLLASMIVPSQELVNSSVFLKEIYNSILTEAWSNSDSIFKTDFSVEDEDEGKFEVSSAGANLGISKVSFILTGNSASASESTICGLMPYMDVVIAGERSHGKYCGGIIIDGPTWYGWNQSAFGEQTYKAALEYTDNWGIYVMVSRYANRDGNTPCMPNGFEPNISVADNPLDGHQLGDPEETMLAAVLSGKAPEQSRRGIQTGPARLPEQIEKPSFRIIDLAKPLTK